MFSEDELRGAGRWQVEMFESVWLQNTGDDNYVVKQLPPEAQISPIYGFCVDDFNNDGYQDILEGGNFYKNQLSIGKFDAATASKKPTVTTPILIKSVEARFFFFKAPRSAVCCADRS